ncbi:MAG: hypothetical protein V3R25_03170 [Nitrosomonadaceae bacterium]
MKSVYYFLLFLTALMSSCVSINSKFDSKLDQSKAVSLTHIHIVPIEAPPLSGPDLLLMLLMDLPRANKQSTTLSQIAEDLLNKNEIWEPTVEIAKETMRQLETVSNYSVSVDPEIKPVPGVKRKEITNLKEDWLTPLRKFYNMDTSPFSYPEQPSTGAVLEVGLLNYNIYYGDQFLVFVMMKLVDPASGSIMANAQCSLWYYSINPIHNDSSFFASDNGFKKNFRETMAAIVPNCIKYLGFSKK